MDKDHLKKALLKGIPCGLAVALLVALIRMLIRGGNYTDQLFSVFGITSLICFPIAWVFYFFNQNKQKEKK